LHLQSVGMPLVAAGALASVGHGKHAVLPLLLYVSAAQSPHVDTSTAASVAEDLPLAQAVHGAEPADGLNLPATHAVQDTPSRPV